LRLFQADFDELGVLDWANSGVLHSSFSLGLIIA
jgi:hypothetical protein